MFEQLFGNFRIQGAFRSLLSHLQTSEPNKNRPELVKTRENKQTPCAWCRLSDKIVAVNRTWPVERYHGQTTFYLIPKKSRPVVFSLISWSPTNNEKSVYEGVYWLRFLCAFYDVLVHGQGHSTAPSAEERVLKNHALKRAAPRVIHLPHFAKIS